MSESNSQVGYGRPPRNTQFQKGTSGNPGGKPGPKKRLKRQFDAALSGALQGSRWTLKDAKPANVIQAFARKVALDALDGRASAQKLVLTILDGEESTGDGLDAADNDPHARLLLGTRYDEFKQRFEAAIANGSGEELLAIAREFHALDKFPQSGNFSGNFEKKDDHAETANPEDEQKK
ncbi:MAG TPA: DUF5681 domain-containing protein [Rhizomicrobium sp.]|jgi:hypothetical protein|nr:DUF5681 domain-containing protein [Rhizomicrobium sp.]